MNTKQYNLYDSNNNLYQVSLNDILNCNNICFGYVRQSTQQQKSLEEQIFEIKKQAFIDNYDFVIIFSCKGSGWKINNINKLKDFKLMCKLFSTLKVNNFGDIRLYIYDVSRFMRNVLIATKFINDVFEPNNCEIHSIIDNRKWNNNSNNKLDFLRELIESESYSVLLSNKMKINSQNRKQKGNHIGGIKFGYERYKNNSKIMKLRKNNKEQQILGYIKKRKHELDVVSKKYLYTSLCHNLNSNKLYKRNKKWNYNMINRIVKSNLSNIEECNLTNQKNDDWIQCDICDKWRKIPTKLFSILSLKNNFSCEDVQCLNCNIPEEIYKSSFEESFEKLNLN